MQIRVEISQRSGPRKGLRVRKTKLTFGRVVGFGGHGKGRYATVITMGLKIRRIQCPGGYWARAGKKFVCVDLEHPIGADHEYRPELNSRVWFEESLHENVVNEVWTTYEAIKVVRDLEHTATLTWHETKVAHKKGEEDPPDRDTVILHVCLMIEDGNQPPDLVERLVAEDLLKEERIRTALDEAGITYTYVE